MPYTTEEVIVALYNAVFGRDPDDHGMFSFSNLIESQELSLMEFAKRLHESDEHKLLINKSPGLSDHSQFGEFLLILKKVVNTSPIKKIIVDVGARGRERSNSYDLLKNFSWHGILVEANPKLVFGISLEFKNTHHKLVNCAISDREGVVPFYIGVNDDVSSLLSDHASNWGAVRSEIDVQARRLHDVLSELAVPMDFGILSLDIEGLDVRVLNDLIENSSYRPNFVIIEASHNFSTKLLSDVGASNMVCDLYKIFDQTEANLLLELNT